MIFKKYNLFKIDTHPVLRGIEGGEGQ